MTSARVPDAAVSRSIVINHRFSAAAAAVMCPLWCARAERCAHLKQGRGGGRPRRSDRARPAAALFGPPRRFVFPFSDDDFPLRGTEVVGACALPAAAAAATTGQKSKRTIIIICFPSVFYRVSIMIQRIVIRLVRDTRCSSQVYAVHLVSRPTQMCIVLRSI